MILYLVLIHNIANAVVFPFADPLGKGLRAAGDAMLTMGITFVTTMSVRVICWIRVRQVKWKTYRVIGE